MADRMMMQRRGDMLVPADQQAVEVLRSLPVGQPLGVDTVQVRNAGLHRKAFALMQLAFDYWQPENLVSTVERKTVHKLGKFMVDNGVDRDAARNLCGQFLRKLNASRETLEPEKSFEAFREFVTVEAGFCDTVITPSGPKRVAKSWAYKNMSEARFQELYGAVFEVLWRLVLKQTFASPDEAETAAMALLGFDS